MIRVDGQDVSVIPATDRGLAYGDGVWETIALRQGRLMQLEAHLERLATGLTRLGIAYDHRNLEARIRTACDERDTAVIKVIITRGDGQRGYRAEPDAVPREIISIHPMPEFPERYSAHGIDVFDCQTRLARNPALAGFKHLNRLEQVMARREFGAEYQEGLVCDYRQLVVEGTMSNVFLVDQQNRVITPQLTHCGINGIARSCIIGQLEKSAIAVEIRDIPYQQLDTIKAMFFSNSLIRLWPVKRFMNRELAIPDFVRELQGKLEPIL